MNRAIPTEDRSREERSGNLFMFCAQLLLSFLQAEGNIKGRQQQLFSCLLWSLPPLLSSFLHHHLSSHSLQLSFLLLHPVVVKPFLNCRPRGEAGKEHDIPMVFSSQHPALVVDSSLSLPILLLPTFYLSIWFFMILMSHRSM